MKIEKDYKYTKNHEWVAQEDGQARIGISDYAQEELGELVFVDFDATPDEFSVGDEIVLLESSKAVASVYAPIDGELVEINEELEDIPEKINEDCFGEGWLVSLKLKDASQLDKLMTADQYKEYVDSLE